VANSIFSQTLLALTLVFSCLCLADAHAGVALGATRVVYPSDQKQVSLAVSNSDTKGRYLVYSWIENSEGEKDSRFVITPPLLVMDGKKENILRIIDATNGSLPKDRESLFWITVKAIPSMDKSKEKENTLQLAISSRIKLLYRPIGLKSVSHKAYEQLRFSSGEGLLTVINPTPYYLTLTELSMGNRALGNVMVSPKDTASVKLPEGSTGEIVYQTVNDYGALTPKIKGIAK